MLKDISISVADGKGWDDYVFKHPKSLFYHLGGWGEALQEVFGFKKIYLQAGFGGEICGVLPLIFIDSVLGKRLVSIPIGVCAGALADNEPVRKALIDKAIALTRELGCGYLELRNMEKTGLELPAKTLYASFIKGLPADSCECLAQMPRKARAAARHAIDNGLVFDAGPKYIDDCYDIYAISQRHLGSPVVSRKWFKKLFSVFNDKTNIFIVKFNGKILAAVLTFFYKDTVLPFYGGCDPGFFRLNPNDYMYLKLQEYGVENGFRYFDFGRSRAGSGSYQFKVNLGFKPAELYYEYYLNKAGSMPEINPSNRAFKLAQNIWKRLPLPVTKWLGPALYKFVIP